jgi:hypothetical protein
VIAFWFSDPAVDAVVDDVDQHPERKDNFISAIA